MKILVCGFGKCGSRMVLDLNCLVHGGKNSYELRVQKSPLVNKSAVESVIGWFRNFFTSNRSRITYIPQDDLPSLHMGDSDPDNEITGGYLVSCAEESEEDKKRIDKHLKALIDNKVVFSNFDDACGQYHSIGEMVMDDLLKRDENTRVRIVQNPVRDCRCYICCFSAGGGTGCGVSSRLISHVLEEAESKYKTIFTGGYPPGKV